MSMHGVDETGNEHRRGMGLRKKLKSPNSSGFRWGFVVLLVLVSMLLLLGRRWLNSSFPAGTDTLSALTQSWQLRTQLAQYRFFPGWNQYWFLGCYNSIIALPQIVSLLPLDNFWLKMFFLINQAVAGLLMYLFTAKVTQSRFAGLISGVFYSLFPFSLLMMVECGFLSICMAYTIAPLVFIALEMHSRKLTNKSAIVAGLAFAALILTHRQIVILLGPLVIFYMLFLFIRLIRSHATPIITAIRFFSPLVIALLLSAYWWLPFWAEREFLSSTSFSLSSSEPYSPSVINSLTFWARHELEASWRLLLSFLPVTLAFLAPILEARNRTVIFFSLMAIVFITLSMGTNSPIPLYGFAFRYIPFVDAIRTPARFSLAAGLSLAVLSGYAIRYLVAQLNSQKALIAVSVIALALFAGVFGQGSALFKTWDLNPSENAAMAWLAKQEDGRLVSLPRTIWCHSEARGGRHVNPWLLTHLHEKETLNGSIPNLQFEPSVVLRRVMRRQLYQGLVSHNNLLDILGIRYLALDGYYASQIPENLLTVIHNDLTENDKFEEVFHSGNVAIFRNKKPFPRIFLQKNIDKASNLFDPGSGEWFQVEKTQSVLRWDKQIALRDQSLCCSYIFAKEGRDTLSIEHDLNEDELGSCDAFGFHCYISNKPDDVEMIVNLFERDGGRYRFVIKTELQQGWNYVELPLSLFYPAYKEDPNRRLDKNEIETIWIGIVETGSYAHPKYFSIYFDDFTMIEYEYNFDQVSFELVHPGKYRVNANIGEPCYLVLTESYHPRWIAKDAQTGAVIARAEPLYIGLNGFWLQEGKHELVLEYEESLPQKVGNTLSILTLIACLGWLVKAPVQKLLQRKLR